MCVLSEIRHIDDMVILVTAFCFLSSKMYEFYDAVGLYGYVSQKASKCDKNISNILGCVLFTTFLFLSHFDDICDLLFNRIYFLIDNTQGRWAGNHRH